MKTLLTLEQNGTQPPTGLNSSNQSLPNILNHTLPYLPQSCSVKMKSLLTLTALAAAIAVSLAEPVPIPEIKAPKINGVQTVGRIVDGVQLFQEPVSNLKMRSQSAS